MPLLTTQSAKGYGWSNVVGPSELTAYNSIASYTVTSASTSSITFNTIPQTYKHLVVRMSLKVTGSSLATIWYYPNGNTGSSDYYYYQMYSNGTSRSSGGGSGQTGSDTAYVPSASQTNAFGASIMLLPDYTNSTSIKSQQTLTGFAAGSGANFIILRGGAYYGTGSTNPITSLTFTPNTGSIAQYSTIALYGIKG
jgi:hypothetical protein